MNFTAVCTVSVPLMLYAYVVWSCHLQGVAAACLTETDAKGECSELACVGSKGKVFLIAVNTAANNNSIIIMVWQFRSEL